MFGDIDAEAAGADRDDASVFRGDHALFDIAADLPCFGPECPGGPKLRLTDRRSNKATALIDRHRTHNPL